MVISSIVRMNSSAETSSAAPSRAATASSRSQSLCCIAIRSRSRATCRRITSSGEKPGRSRQSRISSSAEAELPEREHLLEPRDVGGRVEPVPRLGVQRRPQQADLVVMVQRADGQPRPLRQLADLQRLNRMTIALLPASPGSVATTVCYGLT